ncbi:MAG: histidine--tRNA ligase [Gammaproteobacteria bacterium]|nr:histidine--tRNA ligase [Gammaproteobacteria bacterium]
MAKLQAIRGMNDILPGQSQGWQFLEGIFHSVVRRFGYQEIRFPVLEQSSLFQRSIGELTDIVEKEMYTFEDRNGDKLSLRPEGTAGCVRAAEQHGLLYNQQQRLWYQGPMFRHERPQKGRYRQFHQFGVEAFGMAGPDIDAEVIKLSAQLWRDLDLIHHLTLEINNIGTASDRKSYSAALTGYLKQHSRALDDDARHRMYSNPLRVLDSKNAQVQAILQEAPVLANFVSPQSREHYEQLKSLLADLDIAFVENRHLVRGLDYYNNCVFEWTTLELGAQGAVCGGGRYDGLVEQLGGKATFACGFAMGIERLVLMLESLEKIPHDALKSIDVYILGADPDDAAQSQKLASAIRQQYPRLGVISHCGGGKSKAQIKRAYNLGATAVITLLADSDPACASIRRLDQSGGAETLEINSLVEQLGRFL